MSKNAKNILWHIVLFLLIFLITIVHLIEQHNNELARYELSKSGQLYGPGIFESIPFILCLIQITFITLGSILIMSFLFFKKSKWLSAIILSILQPIIILIAAFIPTFVLHFSLVVPIFPTLITIFALLWYINICKYCFNLTNVYKKLKKEIIISIIIIALIIPILFIVYKNYLSDTTSIAYIGPWSYKSINYTIKIFPACFYFIGTFILSNAIYKKYCKNEE